MLVAAFRALATQLIVISAITAGTALLAFAVGGTQSAVELLDIGVARMKGPWVWVFGYGLASFICKRGRMLPRDINGIFEPSDAIAAVTGRIERSTYHRYALTYTIPITLLGAVLTNAYGLPAHGISYWILFAMTCSIYYVAAFVLFNFVEITLAFERLLETVDDVRFKRAYSPMHLENFTGYLALTTALGLIGIYSGFRGTLTTGFMFQHEMWKTFLSVPLILFLPGALFYDYYPRYVLRKILQHKVFKAMERLGASDLADARELVLDIKESAVIDSQILPFLDYKSLPSYLLAIFFAISLAYNGDPAVTAFIKYLFNLDSP